MRPRRTKDTNHVFGLLGGTEDNDLWVKTGTTDGRPFSESYWELDDEERQAIADGAMIALRIQGTGMPPLSMYVGSTFEAVRRGAGAVKLILVAAGTHAQYRLVLEQLGELDDDQRVVWVRSPRDTVGMLPDRIVVARPILVAEQLDAEQALAMTSLKRNTPTEIETVWT